MHYNRHLLLFICLLASFFNPQFADAAKKNIYVSSDGNDKSPGTRRFPLASIGAAIELANNLSGDNEVEIHCRKGFYYLETTIEIDADKWKSPRSKLLISGDGMGKTIISGGVSLPKFRKSSRPRIWSVQVPNIDIVTQLFVNGRRAVLARTPNVDMYITPVKASEKILDEKRKVYEQEVEVGDDSRVILSNLKNSSNEIVVSILHSWDLTRKKLKNLNEENNSFNIAGFSIKRWGYFSKPNSAQLYFENNISFLDEPGEFYFESDSHTLYYYSREGEEVENSTAIVPMLDCILRIRGTESMDVNNIEIKDISFSHTRYIFPNEGENPVIQAAALKHAALMVDYSSGISFYNVEISHTGEYGIWFRAGCSKSKIQNCFLHDLGAGGIKIGVTETITQEMAKMTRNITVDNNIIREGGRTLPTAVGIIVFGASDCSITHNEINDLYYTGISVGWTWGFDDSPSKRNYIGYNHIHHLGWGALSDMGGIYTLGKSEGTIITNNIIHHVYSYGEDGNGIYTDEGSSGLLIRNNLVYKCKSAGFAQHYGKDNNVINNIFIDNINAQLSTGFVDIKKNSLMFTNNIVCANESSKKVYVNEQWGKYPAFESDYNIFWCKAGDKIFCGYNLSIWDKKTGKEGHSIFADPLIVFEDNSIRIKNNEALKRISFKQFETNSVGVYGSKNWKKLAEMSLERLSLYDNQVNKFEEAEKYSNSSGIWSKTSSALLLLATISVSSVAGYWALKRNR